MFQYLVWYKLRARKFILMDSIGNRLKFIRGKQSGEDFSKSLNLHPQTIYRYERGERKPDIDFIQLVAKETGFCIEWIINGKGPMHPDELPVSPKQSLIQPESLTMEVCARCAKLEAKLEKVENQRDELAAENRKLWKENGELKERCARLEPRQKQEEAHPFDERRKISGSSDVVQSRA